jgi:hypothetical protein
MRARYVFLPAAIVVAACNTDRSESAARDLTLLPSTESATAGIASARELDLPRPDAGATSTSAAQAPTLAPARVRARPAQRTSHAAEVAPVPSPSTEPAPSSPAPGASDAALGGAGVALNPGQTVTVVPASSGAGSTPFPATDVSTARGMRARPVIIIGDDRCIPGRGEVIPRGPGNWNPVR